MLLQKMKNRVVRSKYLCLMKHRTLQRNLSHAWLCAIKQHVNRGQQEGKHSSISVVSTL